MIEVELLILIGLVAAGFLAAIYAWMCHSPKFDYLVKLMEFQPTEEQKQEKERREQEERERAEVKRKARHYE